MNARLRNQKRTRRPARGHQVLKKTAWFWESFTPKCIWGFWAFGTLAAALFLAPHVYTFSTQTAALMRSAMESASIYAACCLVLMFVGKRLLAAR